MVVTRLRRKIETNPQLPRLLVTVPGVGYKLAARPQSTDVRQSQLPAAEPEKRPITVLACEPVGAMELALKSDPEDLSRMIRAFQDAAISAIRQMGGTIATVAPDQVLALFGYPEAHEDDAERAVDAGLDVIAQNSALSPPQGFQVRLGIASGLALATEAQAIGEPSFVAIGLCDLASPNSILVAASTRRLLGSRFVCESPSQYVLTGASEPLNACRVTGRRDVASRFKGKHSNTALRLIGRDQELRQLLALWKRAKAGEGQVALICGEAGIGKSHLCKSFLQCLRKKSYATFRYQCSERHLHSPFYPVINQLEHAMGFEQTDGPELKLKKLEAGLRHAVETSQEELALYARLLSISKPKSDPSFDVTPQRQKDLTISALCRRLQSLAAKRPLIIVLADAHWINSSTLELVDKLIPLIKTARVLFAIEFRPEFSPRWLDEPHVTLLHLDRLGRDQSLAIISEVTEHKNLPSELEEQIISKADGVPLFIEELTKSVQELELLRVVGNDYVATGPLDSLSLPASLRESLTARLDRLGPAKEVAQIGAVIGREFSYALLATVAAEHASSLEASLADLVASEIISRSDGYSDVRYVFKHVLVRDAAYATLSRDKRKELHSRIAVALESKFPSMVETQPELLAYHLENAGLMASAIDYLRKAGQRAIEQSANNEAIKHLTHALQLLRSTDQTVLPKSAQLSLEAMLSQAMIARYGYAAPKTREMLIAAGALIDDTTEPSLKFSLLYGKWASHYVGGEVAKQRSAAAEFLTEADRTGDVAIRCIAHKIVGTTHVTMGEFARGLHHLEQSLALYDPKRHVGYRYHYGQDVGAATLCYLSWALWHLGHIDQALRTAREAMRLAEKASHPHTLVYTICHARDFMDLFQRRHQHIQTYANLVVSLCKENGFSHWANCGTIFDGWAAVCGGQVDWGIKLLRKGIAGWQEAGARLWMPMFLKLEAEAYAKAGWDQTALQKIEEALNTCKSTGERWAMAELLRTKATLLLSMGQGSSSDIESILLNSLEIARNQQARCWELRTAKDLSRLWQRDGRSAKALQLLQPLYDQFTEGSDTQDLLDAKILLRNLRRDAKK